jgi:hypothetical protein
MVTMSAPILVDAYAAELATGVKPATVRQWIRRKKITTHGTDHAGRTLVNLRDIQNLKHT